MAYKRILQPIQYQCYLCGKVPQKYGILWNVRGQIWCDECYLKTKETRKR